MEEIVATEIDPLKVDVCDPFPVQTGSYSYTMEELEQSSLEEKVDLGNLVLFPPESYVNKAIEEVNFTIKEESSENKIDCDISDKTNIKKEVIEPPVHEYEKTQIEFSTNSNVKCQTCGLEFGNKVVLKIHNSMVHPEGKKIDQNKIRNSIPKDKDFNSPITSSFHEGVKNNVVQKQTKKTSFNQKYNSKTYIETIHEKNKPSRRDISYSKSALKSIMISQTENLQMNDQTKPYKCIDCDHRSANKKALSRHIKRVHDGSKSFKCSACDFETANEFHLKKHTLSDVHKGSKPFKCKLCNFETAQKSDLKFHIESVHEGIKPFNCCICNYKTSKKYTLKKHIESVHEGIKPFKCNICNYKTSRNYYLKKHIESVHE